MYRCSVARIGGLPYRRLLIGEALELRAGSGLATSATHSTFAHNDAAETSNHLRAGEPAATRGVALRSRIPTGFRPKAQGCEARATLGHRQSIIPNRDAVAAHLFPPARLTSVTTPLALIRFPSAHPR